MAQKQQEISCKAVPHNRARTLFSLTNARRENYENQSNRRQHLRPFTGAFGPLRHHHGSSYILKDGKEYRDGVDITPKDIFAHVAAGGDLCSTAAVNVADYIELFGKFTKDYDAVFHIDISSDFSCCYQNACTAAEEFDNVYVIDSRNLSSGQGHVVVEAAIKGAQWTIPKSFTTILSSLRIA